MRAIVTGGAGFIGSHLIHRLLKEGWSVLALDDLSSGFLRNIPVDAEFNYMDVTDGESIDRLPQGGIDVIFHLASHVGQESSFEKPLFDLKANIFSTMLLLRWALKHKVKQFIFASSMNVYGNPANLPVTETMTVDPPSPYAVGKLSSEYLCSIYQKLGLNTTSLRLFNVYGPGQDMDNMKQGMVSIFMSFVAKNKPVLVRGPAGRFRDFIEVSDVVDAFYRCVDKRAYGKIYNVATGVKTYVYELIYEILRSFRCASTQYSVSYGKPTMQDQFGIYGDSSLIQKDLGWEAVVKLEDGISKMTKWVKK